MAQCCLGRDAREALLEAKVATLSTELHAEVKLREASQVESGCFKSWHTSPKSHNRKTQWFQRKMVNVFRDFFIMTIITYYYQNIIEVRFEKVAIEKESKLAFSDRSSLSYSAGANGRELKERRSSSTA